MLGKIEESWCENYDFKSKLHFKILFNKDEILEYCMYIINTSIYQNNINYDAMFIIYEYAYERYCFDNYDGLLLYFNNTIKSQNIYDNILKCIDCNVFKYDANRILIDTYVRPMQCNYNIRFWDKPLLEKDCINNYSREFKFFNNKPINNNLTSKKIIYGLRILYLRVSYSSILKNEEYLYELDYNLDEILEFVKKKKLY